METLQKADSRKTTSLVKRYLKEKFGIVVSVRSECYSGGSSFNVSYKLGPDSKAIESFVSRLQYGHFNGMEDIYEMSSGHKAPVLYGYELEDFKFVFVRQEISRELKAKFYELAKAVMPSGLEEYQMEQEFSRYFRVKNFITQDEAEIKPIKAVFNYEDQDIEFLYEIDGVLCNTKSGIVRQSSFNPL